MVGEKEPLCPRDAETGDELVRRLAEDLGEEAGEIEGRQVRLARRVRERHAFVEPVSEPVARAAEAGERRRVEEANAARDSFLAGLRTRSHAFLPVFSMIDSNHGSRDAPDRGDPGPRARRDMAARLHPPA